MATQSSAARTDSGARSDSTPDSVPEWQMDPDIVPAPQPEPDSVDDGDEEDGRI